MSCRTSCTEYSETEVVISLPTIFLPTRIHVQYIYACVVYMYKDSQSVPCKAVDVHLATCVASHCCHSGL